MTVLQIFSEEKNMRQKFEKLKTKGSREFEYDSFDHLHDQIA